MCLMTLWGLFHDFLKGFEELSEDFLMTFWGLSEDFLRTFWQLVEDFLETLRGFFKDCWLACFKITMGPPNILTFWHNMLHYITSWMQKKLELTNRIWQGDNFSKFIKGKHGFYNGGKTEKFKIPFLARKIYQYWSRVYQKVQNSNILGDMFPKKS